MLRRFVVSAVTVLLGALLGALAVTAIFLGVEDTVPYLRSWITVALPFALIFFGLWCTAMMLAGLAKRFGVEVKMLRHWTAGVVSVSLVSVPGTGLSLIFATWSQWWAALGIVGLHALISGAVIGWCGHRLRMRWQMSIPAGIVGVVFGVVVVMVWLDRIEPALFQCSPDINCPTTNWGIFLSIVTIPILGCGFHGLCWLVRCSISRFRESVAG